MVKQIVRDVFFLGQPSEPATKAGSAGYVAGEPGTVRWYGCKHDWCKEEYHYCEYGIHRCCDVQSGDCFKTEHV